MAKWPPCSFELDPTISNNVIGFVATGDFFLTMSRSHDNHHGHCARQPCGGEIFTLLQQSVTINNIGDTTTCIRAAASDTTGTVTFHLTPA